MSRALNEHISELWDVTCHMESQCYLLPDTGECVPPSPQSSKPALVLLTPERWKAELTWVAWLNTNKVYPSILKLSPQAYMSHTPNIFVATVRQQVEKLQCWCDIHDVQRKQQCKYLNHCPDQCRACCYAKLLWWKPSQTLESCSYCTENAPL